jgi:hypothetical protein
MSKTLMIEYGTGEVTMVYIVNEKREDVVAVPVLFKENRRAMAEEAWVLAIRR